jgi:hypothetical protein
VSPAKDGSFFAIPVSWARKEPKQRHSDEEDEDGWEPDDEE